MSPPGVSDDLPVLHDEAVASAAVLGEGAPAVMAAVLEPMGATLERSHPKSTVYYPGSRLTVAHEARVRWSDGSRSQETLVLSSGRKPPADALVVSDGHHDVVVWRVPADPWLPGLGPALDPVALRPLLDEVGLASDELRTRLRAYRPGRRAVVEVTGKGARAFLKVVRPKTVEALHRRHELLSGAVPVPASLGWSAEHGIVVLQALPGRTLRQVLLASGALPRPRAVLGLLDALPAADDVDPGADWRAHEFSRHIGAVAPELTDRTDALADGLAPFEAETAAEPPVPVHGDLYEAQLLVDGGRIVGLLDVDTFRTGRRIDDLSTYIGHLAVLAMITPSAQRRIEAHARRLVEGFDQVVDPARLRAGVAGVVLGLATGSFRVLEPRWRDHTEARVTLAERWLDSARDARASRPIG